jgi:hypothetical protein
LRQMAHRRLEPLEFCCASGSPTVKVVSDISPLYFSLSGSLSNDA